MPAGQRDWNAKCPAAVAKGLSPHLPAKNLPALRQGRRREGKQPPRRQQEFARERQAETKKASLTQALAGARRGRWHGQPTRALRSRRRRLLGASAGARLLRFLAARPQTRLEAAAQRPGTPSARCKLHATPQVFSKWQKRWGPTHHSKLQPQEARTGGLGRGRAAPCSDGLAFSLRSWWQQTDHTQRRREALSLACHSWRRDQKLLAHGPPMQGCKHQPAVAVTGRSVCQIH